jgi:hypothetical protein
MHDGTHTIRPNPRNARGEFNYTAAVNGNSAAEESIYSGISIVWRLCQ